jgi:hypothetical protein
VVVVVVVAACWLAFPAAVASWPAISCSSTLTCLRMSPRRSVNDSPVRDSGGVVGVSGGCVEPDAAAVDGGGA